MQQVCPGSGRRYSSFMQPAAKACIVSYLAIHLNIRGAGFSLWFRGSGTIAERYGRALCAAGENFGTLEPLKVAQI